MTAAATMLIMMSYHETRLGFVCPLQPVVVGRRCRHLDSISISLYTIELELHVGHDGWIGVCGGFHSLKDVVELESHDGHGGWIGVWGGFHSLKDVAEGRCWAGVA